MAEGILHCVAESIERYHHLSITYVFLYFDWLSHELIS